VQIVIAIARCGILMTVVLMGRSHRGKYRCRFLQGFASDIDVVFVGRCTPGVSECPRSMPAWRSELNDPGDSGMQWQIENGCWCG
jgi:hypothetical protein